MKTCTKCNKLKESDEFPKHKGTKDGRNSWCRACYNSRRRDKNYQAKQNADRMVRIRANPEKYKDKILRRQYGITFEQYSQMLVNQGEICAICKQPEIVRDTRNGKLKDLSVDHCHETGYVRGLLCDCCNRGIGFLRDNAAICRAASDYLNKNRVCLADPIKSSQVD